MELTTRRDVLLETLGKVRPVVGKSYFPAANMLLLVADGNTLTVTGTDLATAVVARCRAKVAKAGSLCVDPSFLIPLLKAAESETVTLNGRVRTRRWTEQAPKYDGEGNVTYEDVKRSTKTASFTIDAGPLSSSADALPPADFPKTVPTVTGKGVKLLNLARAIGQVLYAVATEDSRPALTTLCFQSKRGRMAIVAADGFRLAVTQTKARGQWDEGDVLVPSSGAKLVGKLMTGPVTATLVGEGDDRAVAFSANGLTIWAQCVQGTFPAYEQLIPKRGRALTLSAAALLKAVKTVMGLKPNADIVRLRTRSGHLVVSGKCEDREVTIKVPAKGTAKIAFNGKYLADLLGRVEEQVTFRLTSPSSPGVVESNGSTHVLMPQYVNW